MISYPAFILAWLHGFNAWDFVYEWIMKNLYILLWVVLFLAILVRIFYQLWFLKQKVKILENKQLTDDIFKLSVEVKNFTCQPGQFVYIWDKKFSHPFSILDYEDWKLKIAYKVIWDFTNFLSKKNPGQILYLDWSYWSFLQSVKSWDIFIAGWIGITPFYSYLKKNDDVGLIYLNQSPEKTVFLEDLENKLKEFYNIFSRTGWENEKYIYKWTRLDQRILEKILDWNIDRNFFICWSQSLVEQISQSLKNLWVKKTQIKFEPFSM